MSDREMQAMVARALGRPISGVAEQRLVNLLWMVLAAGGGKAEAIACTTCDLYAGLMACGDLAPAPPALIDVARAVHATFERQ